MELQKTLARAQAAPSYVQYVEYLQPSMKETFAKAFDFLRWIADDAEVQIADRLLNLPSAEDVPDVEPHACSRSGCSLRYFEKENDLRNAEQWLQETRSRIAHMPDGQHMPSSPCYVGWYTYVPDQRKQQYIEHSSSSPLMNLVDAIARTVLLNISYHTSLVPTYRVGVSMAAARAECGKFFNIRSLAPHQLEEEIITRVCVQEAVSKDNERSIRKIEIKNANENR
ncbi:hypothetical protein BU16DRAFT_615979 [Lophium mytilinum]|uniref:Uncharacterized protein n=1 Tax=Lophium mytilinum TaxID=390894 RepID=A0A6A6QYH6_9PEZI|nr:hypothetical protein BU16DRAFT_615979 [Lophium mytilinum]